MKKLKKSSLGRNQTLGRSPMGEPGEAKNKRPTVVFIYGPIAAGKLTVAEELAKRTGYKVFHNHLIIDLAKELFGKEDPRRPFFREGIYFDAVNRLTKLGVSLIITHAFSTNFISKTGLTDPVWVRKTEKIVLKNGAKFYGVQLLCDESVLLKRLKDKSRYKYHKLRNAKMMKELLKVYDHATPAPIKNDFAIDNTNLSPQKVADMIIKHFKLK